MICMEAWNSKQVFTDATSDGSNVTIYSDRFSTPADVWSFHLDIQEDTATYAATVEVWASDKPDPTPNVDADWVQQIGVHGFTGMPLGNPSGGNYKDLADVSASGTLWYHIRIVRSTGAGTANCWVSQKRND